MPKTAGTYPMTPIEDHIARALSLAGLSSREIAKMLGRSDKTISLAFERASASEDDHPLLRMASQKEVLKSLSASDKRLLTNILGFSQWLSSGRENGYVAALVRLIRG